MNSLSSYKSRIRTNFSVYDGFLEGLQTRPQIHKICFALRTPYAVYQEIHNRQGGNTALGALKQILKLAVHILAMPFQRYSLTGRGNVLLLGKGDRDASVADYLGLPLAIINKDFTFSLQLRNVLLYPVIFSAWASLIRSRHLNKRYVITMLLAQAIDVALIPGQLDLEGVRMIVTENDIDPEMVTVLQAARERSIPSIKIEYVLIDDTHHNNVFCDYYFYPSIFHRHVREVFSINQGLKYIEGGFPNWDAAARYIYTPQESPRIISFFTQHGDLGGEQDELFYLEELLSLIDEQYIICIKLHPLDRIEKYEKYRHDSRCTIIEDRSTDSNYELITRSYLCMSMFSVISLEAKLICNRSIFLHYGPPNSETILDYRAFEPYFDVVRDRESLRLILQDNFSFATREVFLKNICMTYPDTGKALLSLVQTLS